MASAVADLEAGLQAMLNLKPPGVSGSRINNLTTLCVANIQSESVLIQKIYTHFKKTPGTHKLGVLYVVDSVTRKWLEQAKSQGQPINGSAQDGTYAAGVHRVTELMPVLMNDILSSIPQEQKEKIKKLLDIWEKGQTFPSSMLESFKEKLNAAPQPQTAASTTPPGSPPANPLGSNQVNGSGQPAPSAPPANGSSILEALANIARQNTSTAPTASAPPAAAASYNVPASNLPQPVAPSMPPQQQPAMPYAQNTQPVNMPPLPFSLPQVTGQNAQSTAPPGNTNTYPAAGGQGAGGNANGAGLDATTQQQIMLIKALADQGVPFDKIPALIHSMTGSPGVGASAPQATAPLPGQNSYPAASHSSWAPPTGRPDAGHSRGYENGVRSPPRHGRTRSRSPDRGWGTRDSPRGGRDRNNYGSDTPPRGHDDRGHGGRKGHDYRQRSPQRRYGHSPSPSRDLPGTEKWIDHDPSLPSGTIKVLSRTLFVGGVTCPEPQLRNIFGRFGTVQTCIVNKEKRHAFVKMLTRRDAMSAKEGTEDSRGLDVPLRTRWGVGFGPRDCSDYSTGISVIPIQRLTEADVKWMKTAPYGGCGDQEIVSGMCVEEPDIEIGAGVSSKAISRRMQTDKGGSHGPKSTRQRDDDSTNRWPRRRDGWDEDHNQRRDGSRNEGQQQAAMPFPFGMGSLPNAMPEFPAGGYGFPDPNGQGR